MALSLEQTTKQASKKRSTNAAKKTAKTKAPAKKVAPAKHAASAKAAEKSKSALKKVAAQKKTRQAVKPWQTVKPVQVSQSESTAARIEELIKNNLPKPVLNLINQNVAGGVHSLVSQGFLLFEMGKSINSDMILEELRSREALLRQKALKLQEKLPMPKALVQILTGR